MADCANPEQPDIRGGPEIELLRICDLTVDYAGGKRAVDGVTFSLIKGQTTGLVGESGCGKSTIAQAIVRLLRPASGNIFYRDCNLTRLGDRDFFAYRKKIQMVFQDPHGSLNPELTIEEILEEPFRVHFSGWSSEKRLQRKQELLELVGIEKAAMKRFPREFSGGQKQRIGVARALAVEPEILVCDEPVSALDVSIQAQIINLLQDIQDQTGITYLIIAHDLAVVEHVSDTILVMFQGKIVESLSADDLFKQPHHPYTEQLLSAVPVLQRYAPDM